MEFKEGLQTYQQIINQELEKYLRKENGLEKVLNESVKLAV